MKTILSIDPGKCKTGIAVLNIEKKILEKKIVDTAEFSGYIKDCISMYNPDKIIIGRGTSSVSLLNELKKISKLEFVLADEKNTTVMARQRYFSENPPKGLWRFIPLSLQTPPVLYYDYAAVIIGENYLNRRKHEKK